MTYDHWKATNPADEFLGPQPEENDMSGIEDLSKLQLAQTLADLYGFIVLIRGRSDLPIEVRDAIDTNHRCVHARDILRTARMIQSDEGAAL